VYQASRSSAEPRDLWSRLAHLDGRLDGVQVLPAGAPLPAWRRTRLNARYAGVLRLAEIVLRKTAATRGLAPACGGDTVQVMRPPRRKKHTKHPDSR
jgi:hypothetical protein